MPKGFVACLAIFLWLAGLSAYAKPPDARALAELPRLRKIAAAVRSDHPLSDRDRVYLMGCLEGRDRVVLSIAAWIAGESKAGDVDLDRSLAAGQKGAESMPASFFQIALEKRQARFRKQPWSPDRMQLAAENPFLRVEVAREILLEDREEGKKQLSRLAEEPDFVGDLARWLLASYEWHSPIVTFSFEEYATVISVIWKLTFPATYPAR
jgi:hypothetical protein